MVWLPNQAPGAAVLAGLNRSELEAAAWAISPCGGRHRGAAAIALSLDQLLPAGLPLFRFLCALPGFRQLADLGYAWIARNRHHLPGKAICDIRPPEPVGDRLRWEIERRRDRAAWEAGA